MLSSPSFIPKNSSPDRYARASSVMKRLGCSMLTCPVVQVLGSCFVCDGHCAFGVRLARSLGCDGPHESQRGGDCGLHLSAIDDEVQHALFQKEFGSLESLRQLLPDR